MIPWEESIQSRMKESCMRPASKTTLCLFTNISLVLTLAAALAAPARSQVEGAAGSQFQLSSSTVTDGSTLPISTINNIVNNGVNGCSIDGSAGGNQSPDLEWSNAPSNTKTFVVVLYDVTAAFTHWGMYNIAGTATGLPTNAGVAGSSFGPQVFNDFFTGEEYDGPCPPVGVTPYTHHYVFTVYALDATLQLPGSPNFPPSAETLYHALITAGRDRHILASARLVGLYSTTPSK